MIIGDGAVGKTSFLIRFCKNEFSEVYIPTVFENYTHKYEQNGVENAFKWVMIFFQTILELYHNNDFQLFRVFDTAGQEEYKDVRALAYPDTNVLIIAFSIVSRQSFDNVKNEWMKEMKQYMRPLPKTVTYCQAWVQVPHVAIVAVHVVIFCAGWMTSKVQSYGLVGEIMSSPGKGVLSISHFPIPNSPFPIP